MDGHFNTHKITWSASIYVISRTESDFHYTLNFYVPWMKYRTNTIEKNNNIVHANTNWDSLSRRLGKMDVCGKVSVFKKYIVPNKCNLMCESFVFVSWIKVLSCALVISETCSFLPFHHIHTMHKKKQQLMLLFCFYCATHYILNIIPGLTLPYTKDICLHQKSIIRSHTSLLPYTATIHITKLHRVMVENR